MLSAATNSGSRRVHDAKFLRCNRRLLALEREPRIHSVAGIRDGSGRRRRGIAAELERVTGVHGVVSRKGKLVVLADAAA